MLALSKRFIVLDALAAPDTPHHCLFLSLAIGWDQNRNWLADDFLGKVVKNAPRAAVPTRDDAIKVLSDDCEGVRSGRDVSWRLNIKWPSHEGDARRILMGAICLPRSSSQNDVCSVLRRVMFGDAITERRQIDAGIHRFALS